MIDEKQPKDEEYFNYLGSTITNEERYAREIKFKIAMAIAAFNKKTIFTKKIGFKFKEEFSKMLHLEYSLVRW